MFGRAKPARYDKLDKHRRKRCTAAHVVLAIFITASVLVLTLYFFSLSSNRATAADSIYLPAHTQPADFLSTSRVSEILLDSDDALDEQENEEEEEEEEEEEVDKGGEEIGAETTLKGEEEVVGIEKAEVSGVGEEKGVSLNVEEKENYWPLPPRIVPTNPMLLVNFRTKACSYFCKVHQDMGYKVSGLNPHRLPPELLLISYTKYYHYNTLKNTMINVVGKGSSCIGGGKGRQLLCREQLAERYGCKFGDLGVQPRQWNIAITARCKEFYAFAGKPENKGKIWIAKPGGSFHGRGITIHDSLVTLQKKFGKCDRAQRDGIIIQEYVSDPVLMGGHKFDMRSYLLIASTDPFIVFYHDGFVRRSENKYSSDSGNLKDTKAHITNDASQSSENHFFGFDQLQAVLTEEHQFPPHFLNETFRPHALRVSNYLFHTSYDKPKGLLPTKGRFQLFALDWMIDKNQGIHLLEGNGNPLLTHYPKTGLTPRVWTSMIELIRMLHITPEKLERPLSVRDRYAHGGWLLVHNQVEVEALKRKYNPCQYKEYLSKSDDMFSYQQYGEGEW